MIAFSTIDHKDATTVVPVVARLHVSHTTGNLILEMNGISVLSVDTYTGRVKLTAGIMNEDFPGFELTQFGTLDVIDDGKTL